MGLSGPNGDLYGIPERRGPNPLTLGGNAVRPIS
jgi:hypothetical protein